MAEYSVKGYFVNQMAKTAEQLKLTAAQYEAFLKLANDTLGHEVGDMMIREFGAIVHKNVSGEMLGMRYGGDEFVLFGGYKDGQEDAVEKVVQSIRDDMKDINQTGKHPFQLSASIGVSTLKARDITSLETIIEHADQKMYQEKRAKKLAAKNNK